MADGPSPVENFKNSILGKFRKLNPSPAPRPIPTTTFNRPAPEVQTESTDAQTPAPEVKQEEPPIVPDIKNSYGNKSRFQVTVDGWENGKWQYAIRDTHTVDAHYPKGHLLRVPGTATEQNFMGDVQHFGSADEALDSALAKNRKKTAWDTDNEGKFPEVIHYDPRDKTPEEET